MLLQAAHKCSESGLLDMSNGDDEDLDTGRDSEGESIKAHGGIGAWVACLSLPPLLDADEERCYLLGNPWPLVIRLTVFEHGALTIPIREISPRSLLWFSTLHQSYPEHFFGRVQEPRRKELHNDAPILLVRRVQHQKQKHKAAPPLRHPLPLVFCIFLFLIFFQNICSLIFPLASVYFGVYLGRRCTRWHMRICFVIATRGLLTLELFASERQQFLTPGLLLPHMQWAA